MGDDKNKNEAAATGFAVDFEMKILLVTAIFSILKFLKNFYWFLISICWIFFIVGHLFFYYSFIQTTQLINMFVDISTEDKTKAHQNCQRLFRDLMFRGAMVVVFHFSTNMIPPLIISVFMGCFSMIENYDYYELLYRKYPFVFELFFY